MAETIASAVSIALEPSSPASERERAYHYLDSIKSAAETTWKDCFLLFLNKAQYGPNARLFALQVLDEAIGNGSGVLDAATLLSIKESLMSFINEEYVHGQAEGSNTFLRNKLAKTLFLIFLRAYQSTWPDFFTGFIGLTNLNQPPIQIQTTDLLLRLLHEISTELSDTSLRLNKPYARLSKDSEMRDLIRSRDAPQIAAALFQILSNCLEGLSGNKSDFSGRVAEEITELTVQVVGDYVSWIDINLMITETSVPLIFSCLQLPQPKIRTATVEALIETITKGMPAQDKIQLIVVLNTQDILQQLLDHSTSQQSKNMYNSDEDAFREKLARFLNAVGVELTKIVEESSHPQELKLQARAMIMTLLSMLLTFLADSNDDISASVLPFTSNLLTFFKKEKKRDFANHLSAEKASFLSDLLSVTLRKMSYGPDAEWLAGGADDDEEEVTHLAEKRKNLKVISHAVAWIAESTYMACVQTLIGSVLDTIDAGKTSTLTWQQVELALHVLYDLGEAVKMGTGVAMYVQVPQAEKTRAKKEDQKINYLAFPLSPLGALMLRTIKSQISSFPHPCAPLNLFECVNRYHEIFALWPEELPNVLEPMLDARGVHQPHQAVQCRTFYLFLRFVIHNKDQLAHILSSDTIGHMMASLGPLLIIKPELQLKDAGSDLLTHSAHNTGAFDSQLSLFEAIGHLAHAFGKSQDIQANILQSSVGPLLEAIQTTTSPSTSTSDNLLALLAVHHNMLAVSAIAKGFPHSTAKIDNSTGPYTEIFKVAAETIIASLKALSRVNVVREAALAAFKILVAVLGSIILPVIPSLIEFVIPHLSSSELADFLHFLSLLIVKYKEDFVQVLDILFAQIAARVFATLEQPVQGTDDELLHSELRRAYFGLVLTLFSNNFQSLLLSQHNQDNLETILNSIVHYTVVEGKILDQKSGFQLLARMVSSWMLPQGAQTAPVNGNASSEQGIPGFEQFCYQQPLKACFEIPLRDGFDYGDAQSYNVLGEMAIYLKAINTKRKDEFNQLLLEITLPSYNLSSVKAGEFVQALNSTIDGKAFKKYYAPLMQSLKREASNKASVT